MTNSNDQNEYNELPVAVVDSLKLQFQETIEIPESVEQKILRDAAQHLQQPRPTIATTSRNPVRGWPLAAVSLASVAALVVTVSLSWMSVNDESPAMVASDSGVPLPETVSAELSTGQHAPGDIDQSGAVDILDAFALARHIENSEQMNTAWDQNQDGELNDQDVELVARIAVML